MRYVLTHPSTRWMVRETLTPTPSRRRHHRPGPARCPEVTPESAPEAAAAPEAAPVGDPFDDADALEDLGDEIATLAAHIHAATHRLLVLIAEFDRREGWKLGGHRSCAHWLSFRTGIDRSTAREKVRTARALVGLPLIGASMAQGKLSFSKVRALSRVATPDNEGELLECAEGATTAQVERMVRGYRKGSRRDEAALEEERHRNRSFAVFPDVDGMYVVRGRLTPELGALVMRAVEAASDALYRKDRRMRAGSDEEEAWDRILEALDGEEGGGSSAAAAARRARDTEREAARRRADALGLVVERGLEAGFGDDEAPVSGSRAERYQVVVHVDAETLAEAGPERGAEDAFNTGRSELDDGTRVSGETSRRLACDARRVEMRHGPGGSILDVGRRTRTVPPALRRALEARDQGCRFPGCGLRFAEGHHVKHWADGGETKLDNLVLLCRHHHRLLHEEGWSMQWWGEGRPAFFDPRGGVHYDGRWRWPEDKSISASALVADNQARGIRPHGLTASARWKDEAQIPDPVYFRALEAMGGGGP